MKKIFKRTALLMAFVLVLMQLSACGKPQITGTALLKESYENSLKIDSFKSVFNAKMNVDIPDVMLTMLAANTNALEMVKQIAKSELNAELYQKGQKSHVKIKAKGQEQDLEFVIELFSKDANNIYAKTPASPKFISISPDNPELAQQFDSTKMNELIKKYKSDPKFKETVKKLSSIFVDLFFPEDLVESSDEEIEIDGEKFKARTVKLSIKDFKYIKKVVDNLSEKVGFEKVWEAFVSLIEFIKANKDDFNIPKDALKELEEVNEKKEETEALFNIAMTTAKSQVDNIIKELEENVTLKDFTIKFFVDDSNSVRKLEFNLDLDFKNLDNVIPIKISMDSSISKINKIKDDEIQIPEITEENTIEFSEFLKDFKLF